jgi:hypothetical protein
MTILMFRDLTHPRWIKLKGLLFLLLGLIASTLLLLEAWSLRIAVLLAFAVWSFCRAYYFAFYVLERYVDSGFRYSGLFSCLRFLWKGHRRRPPRQQ